MRSIAKYLLVALLAYALGAATIIGILVLRAERDAKRNTDSYPFLFTPTIETSVKDSFVPPMREESCPPSSQPVEVKHDDQVLLPSGSTLELPYLPMTRGSNDIISWQIHAKMVKPEKLRAVVLRFMDGANRLRDDLRIEMPPEHTNVDMIIDGEDFGVDDQAIAVTTCISS